MGGIAFALFYRGLAIPIAWLADRKSRVNIIASSVALWSLFTAACGLAQNFWHLFLARMGVGIGEAGGVAPSYALISDYLPARRGGRARSPSSRSASRSARRSACSSAAGSAAHLDWRSAFVIVGLAGLPAALLVKLLRPRAGRAAASTSPTARRASRSRRRFRDVARTLLAQTPSFWLLSFGAASGSILGYGLIFWLPSFFNRSFGLELGDVGWFYGSIVLVGGVRGHLARRLVRRPHRTRPAGRLCAHPRHLLPDRGAVLRRRLVRAQPLTSPGSCSRSARCWPSPGSARSSPRSSISSCRRCAPRPRPSFLFINNLIGIGFGIYFLGWLSDAMKAAHGEDSLKYSILYGLGFYLLSALFYLVASRRLRKDWVA